MTRHSPNAKKYSSNGNPGELRRIRYQSHKIPSLELKNNIKNQLQDVEGSLMSERDSANDYFNSYKRLGSEMESSPRNLELDGAPDDSNRQMTDLEKRL